MCGLLSSRPNIPRKRVSLLATAHNIIRATKVTSLGTIRNSPHNIHTPSNRSTIMASSLSIVIRNNSRYRKRLRTINTLRGQISSLILRLLRMNTSLAEGTGRLQIRRLYAYTKSSNRPRQDSASLHQPDSNSGEMPLAVPGPMRSRLRDLITGTPEKGWYESLDSSYMMRTGRAAHQFFIKGRVIAMLWSEAASETSAFPRDASLLHYRDPITIGRFGQPVFSQIRRFVIVRVKRNQHFVYAW